MDAVRVVATAVSVAAAAEAKAKAGAGAVAKLVEELSPVLVDGRP